MVGLLVIVDLDTVRAQESVEEDKYSHLTATTVRL
jgi:hypothetical protein